MNYLVDALQWFFLAYFVGVNLVYLALNLMAIPTLRRHTEIGSISNLPPVYSGFEPPVSVLVPAYNEEATIVTSVRSLLQLDYAEFEVVVVNDGSRDATLERLVEAFDLEPFPEAYWRRLPGKPVRGIYASRTHGSLRVVDKENGGKADALNVGINASRYPLFCAIDADSILQRDSLRRVAQPFLEDPLTIATGGTVRVANGCSVVNGHLEKVDLPGNPLALLQIVEYLRAFLFGRLGWATLNAVLIVSGAFGVFRKEAVIAAGGYREGSMGEDMELIVRMHRTFRLAGKPYRDPLHPGPDLLDGGPGEPRDTQEPAHPLAAGTRRKPVAQPGAPHLQPRRRARAPGLSLLPRLRVPGTLHRGGGVRVHGRPGSGRPHLRRSLRRVPGARLPDGIPALGERAAARGAFVSPLPAPHARRATGPRRGPGECRLPAARDALATGRAGTLPARRACPLGRHEEERRMAERLRTMRSLGPWMVPLIAAGLMLLLGLVAFVEWQTLEGFDAVDEATSQQRELLQDLADTRDLGKAMLDMESAVRGFLLTGREELLDPFELGRADFSVTALALRERWREKSDQADTLERIVAIEAEWRHLHALPLVKLRRDARTPIGKAFDVDAPIITDGKRRMASMRALNDHLEARTAAQIRGLSREISRRAEEARWLALRTGLALLLAIGFMAAVISRGFRTAAERNVALSREIAEREQAEANARASEARFAAFLNGLSEVLVIADDHGRITWTNARLPALFGHSAEELAGASVARLFAHAELPRFEQALSTLRTGTAERSELEAVARSDAGREFPVEIAMSRFEVPQGARIALVIRDVSERKAVDRMKSEFIASVSHELRTPLTAIMGSLALLKEGEVGELAPGTQEFVDMAHANSLRLARLVDDVIDIERIGSGALAFSEELFALPAFLAESVQLNQGYADAHGVAIRLEPPLPDVRLRADRSRLMQAITNLISECVQVLPAWRGSPRGGAHGGRTGALRGHRPRPRHSRSLPRARLREVRAGRRVGFAQGRRHRPRPRDRARDRGAARRNHRLRDRDGTRDDLLGGDAGRREFLKGTQPFRKGRRNP